MGPIAVFITRTIGNMRRNSRMKNLRLMRKRGEHPDDFRIREATEADINQLTAVHVKAWAATYFRYKNPPGYSLRESQWREAFRENDGSWFCYVVENKDGNIIGFAKGRTYQSADIPEYHGELQKIYLLFEYHRLGLGTRLLTKVATRFLAMGIQNMLLFSEPSNPTGWFYEANGAHRLYARNGAFHGGYGWNSLVELSGKGS